ncbi:LOW QUALITY PROTEIN: CASP-like protein 4C1 [Nymphaea colorata]|nr:LOW QUALITY PROTEIN: CASP-like protein 4C1 [Nymphaea colorata]
MMRSPEILRNGEAQASPSPRRNRRRGEEGAPPGFHSTVSLQKLRRFNTLALVFRVVAFCFLLASTVFMAMDSHASPSPRWFDHHAFRYLVAVNSIIAVYSFFEMGAALWEMLNGNTLMPETIQLWFDFTHDQAFAYLLFSANSSATTLTQNLRGGQLCSGSSGSSCGGSDAFCIQSYISIALGFVAFLFLAASTVLSGFRLACFITTGSRFHV